MSDQKRADERLLRVAYLMEHPGEIHALLDELEAVKAREEAVREVVEEKTRGGWCEECKQSLASDVGGGLPEEHALWCFVRRLVAASSPPGIARPSLGEEGT